jgi:hypothetical protein
MNTMNRTAVNYLARKRIILFAKFRRRMKQRFARNEMPEERIISWSDILTNAIQTSRS